MSADEGDFVAGLMLLLTSRIDECEAHFSRGIQDESSIHRRVRSSFGHALVAVVRALISFEDDEKNQALERLLATQKLVSAATSSGVAGWFSFGKSSASSATAQRDAVLANLDLELVGADTGLFVAMIQFTQESAVGIMRGALTLRKSYKIYQKAAKELKELTSGTNLHRRRGSSSLQQMNMLGEDEFKQDRVRSTTTQLVLFEDELYYDAAPSIEDVLGGNSNGYGPLVVLGTTVEDRVRASSRMGNGLFNLVFSLIPPRFASMIGTAMGFETTADRRKGLRYLRLCVDQGTSRSPLAALVLLAFHSAMMILARGVSDDADSQEAFFVLEACLRQYPDSPLFRFFEGRLLRGKSRLTKAVEAFEIAQKCSRTIQQLQYLCQYERAWCCGLSGQPIKAGELFLQVARNSRWAPAFYGYLGACFYYEQAFKSICLTSVEIKSLNLALQQPSSNQNAAADVKSMDRKLLRQALSWFHAVPSLLRKKGGTLPPERFAAQRANEISTFAAKFVTFAAAGTNERTVNLDGCNERTLIKLASALFWPSWEMAYLWNGFFQIEDRELWILNLTQSMDFFKQQLWNDPDFIPKRSGYEAMYHLFRGALLRENGQHYTADLEFAMVIPSIDSSASDLTTERWTVEFAKYERGLCCWEVGATRQAVDWWNSVKDSGHVLDARLKFRLKSALRRMATQQ